MLADVRAVLDWLASGDAPPSAARGAAAALEDADSPYALQGLAGAVAETEAGLRRAIRTPSPAYPPPSPEPDESRAPRARDSFSFHL